MASTSKTNYYNNTVSVCINADHFDRRLNTCANEVISYHVQIVVKKINLITSHSQGLFQLFDFFFQSPIFMDQINSGIKLIKLIKNDCIFIFSVNYLFKKIFSCIEIAARPYKSVIEILFDCLRCFQCVLTFRSMISLRWWHFLINISTVQNKLLTRSTYTIVALFNYLFALDDV